MALDSYLGVHTTTQQPSIFPINLSTCFTSNSSPTNLLSIATESVLLPYRPQIHSTIPISTETSSMRCTDFLPQAIPKATTPKLYTSDSLLALPVLMYSGAK
ncbi:hypothetical protein Scep_001391 [Stephania cephalantha]|uniref:Uncharacterized protein n=1 Tax=Stephania cephalantha TaxID=152367 RepID=A0AAP0LAN9_9MAGN